MALEHDESVKLALYLLLKANDSFNPQDRVNILEEFCSTIDEFDQNSRSALVNSSQLHEQFDQLISAFGIIPEFSDRDFTSYDKGDFKDYDVCTPALLKCALTYVTLVNSRQNDCTAHQSVSAPSSLSSKYQVLSSSVDKTNSAKNSIQTVLPAHIKTTSNVLLKILLLIGGNIRNQVWSSEECQILSLQLLENAMGLYHCDNVHEIVKFEMYYKHDSVSNSIYQSVLAHLLHFLKKPLSRDRWEKNPFLCEVFNWLIPNVKSPCLSDHINQILATCLNFIHSHEIPKKLNGLLSLKHLIENVSKEELQWYNRVDVVYDTLKNQMYSKEELVLDAVLQCMFLVLEVLERKPIDNAEKHHEIMLHLLSNIEMENLIIIRRVWISNLSSFILDCGILCIQHLSRILRVVETFLEIDDSPKEAARIGALQALGNIIVVAWPRMCHHSENSLQFLLKFMISMESSNIECSVREKIVTKTTACVKLLLKINPKLTNVLEEVKQSEKLIMLKRFIDSVLLETVKDQKENEDV